LGVEIPRNIREALFLDAQNKDGKWKLVMKTEIEGIRNHGTFIFLEPGAEPPPGYQEAPLRMIFAVKSNFRRKARLVAGGHKMDATGLTSCISVVHMESTRILNVIAKAQNLQILAGNVGNAYLNADTKENVYVRCGPEFGPELEDRIAIIKKSLYGIKASGAEWHSHFAKTLYAWGFHPTRFDPDVWIKKLQEIYAIKDPKVPDSYLGATYTGCLNETWGITASDYIKEAIRQIEKRLEITLREEKIP
jgi:hypothetical protein